VLSQITTRTMERHGDPQQASQAEGEELKEERLGTTEITDRQQNRITETTFEGDEDTPQVIVQEDDEAEHINVLNNDRSYMLSYIIQK